MSFHPTHVYVTFMMNESTFHATIQSIVTRLLDDIPCRKFRGYCIDYEGKQDFFFNSPVALKQFVHTLDQLFYLAIRAELLNRDHEAIPAAFGIDPFRNNNGKIHPAIILSFPMTEMQSGKVRSQEKMNELIMEFVDKFLRYIEVEHVLLEHFDAQGQKVAYRCKIQHQPAHAKVSYKDYKDIMIDIKNFSSQIY